MKLVLDNIVYVLQQAGGISTYWAEISRRLIRDSYDVSFIESKNKNIVRETLSIDKDWILPDAKQLQLLNRFCSIKLSDINEKFIFHSSYNRITNNANAIKVTTVHDFVHEKYYKGLRRLLHSYQKDKSIASAHKIIAVSQNTKRNLLELHPEIDQTKIEVIYNGASDDFYITGKTEINSKPYLLYIGSREHYKNFDFVVKLLQEMPDYDLYIVGKSFTKRERQFLSVHIPLRYKLYNNVDNKVLNVLYNSASALLYPSSYEGFGIPLLEAMKAGLPFLALNKSSIPEVAGDAGELMDELDIDMFKEGILKIESRRKDYILKGLKQAELFSWEKCYQQTLELYKKLI